VENKVLKYSLIGIGLIAIGTGIYFLVRKVANNSNKKNRKIIITRK